MDCGFWIADLLYRFALSFFIKLTEYLKSKIPNLLGIKVGSIIKGNIAKESIIHTSPSLPFTPCPLPYAPKAFLILPRASSTLLYSLNALIRIYPSPHLPKPTPGVQTTAASSSRRSKNFHESDRPLIHM